MWNKRKGNKKEIYINWFVVLSEKWKHVFTLLLHTTSGLDVTSYVVFLINEDQVYIYNGDWWDIETLYIWKVIDFLGLFLYIWSERR